ncbi:hypothetical protein FRC98_08445 [Lujinxingia vulgaris]|uniref:Uncharacterized protein n=1 Tax=Lujinxingia vulgaris TaxID=2600176 RepID=A0A5C6XFR1_9DELT|nr:hypothetical protein [Lujinxingia vulgaris]TXD37707.1 hypothetical protein FRC98_08445 [Lujinxingia vulgaris]
MRRRWSGIGATALALCLSLAASAKAEQPAEAEGAGGLELPPAFAFLETLERVHTRTRSALWECKNVASALCPCVTIEGDAFNVVLVGVDARADQVRVAELRAGSDKGVWVARDVIFERGPESGPHATLGELRWREAGSAEVFRAEHVEADWGQATLQFDEVRWQSALLDVEPIASPSCEAAEHDGLDVAWPDASGMVVERAEFTRDEGWQLHGGRVAGRLPLARRVPVGERIGGLVPPALRVAPGGLQLELGYYVAAPSLLMRASIDSARIAGVGLSRVAQPVTCARDRCRLQALHLDAAFGGDDQAAVGVDGQLSVGDARRHLGVELETLRLWGESQAAAWRRRRLERNALLRDWRLQRAGVSWGGAHSALQISAAHADLPYAGANAGVRMQDASVVDLVYGGGVDLGALRADLRLSHTERRDAIARGRLGGAQIGVHRTFGDAGRVWIRPRLNLNLAWADVQMPDSTEPPPGPVSGTSADAMVDAGLALRARLGRVTHVLAPRVIAGRRQGAGDLSAFALPLEPGSDEEPTRLLQRDAAFNLAGAVVDQALIFGKGWALGVPLGVMLTDDGRAQNWQSTYQGSVRLVAPVLRKLVVRADAMCHGRCQSLSFAARVEVAWFGPIRSRHVLWRGRGYQPTSPFFDTRFRTDYVLGWHPALAADDAAVFHTSAFFATWRRWAGELRLHGDVQTPTERGGEVTLRYGWPELGWALSMKAAAWPVVGRWAGFVGFSLL